MQAEVEFLSVPSADTPGTVLFLHFNDGHRYMIGRVAEGTSRVCVERSFSLTKVSGLFLTGTSQWSNVGGIIGLLLSLADSKTASKLSSSQKTGPNLDKAFDILSPPNLNHILAAARKYVFRTGIPINIEEVAAPAPHATSDSLDPTWTNEHMRVWAMPILPANTKSRHVFSSRKRTFDEASSSASNDDLPSNFSNGSLTPADIVSLMFNSKWRYEKFFPQPLSQISSATKVYVRDPDTKELIPYTGPRATPDGSVPDITVFARAPWPGSSVLALPEAHPAPESVCYILRLPPKRGKFLTTKAVELNVPRGRLWSELAKGNSVQSSDGQTVTPEMVLEPSTPGSGLAVLDIPGPEYIDDLLSRPEWQADHVIDGVEVVIWILPAKLWDDSKLQNFRAKYDRMQHILASPDVCGNNIIFDRAAVTAMRHRLVDQTIFADLQRGSEGGKKPNAIVAQNGLSLRLQPGVRVQPDLAMPPLDLVNIQENLRQDFEAHPEFNASWKAATHMPAPSSDALDLYGDVQVVILGTGSSHPSPYRNVSGTLICVPEWGNFFLDCGEGTLNNLRRMTTPEELHSYLADLKMIWISHLHADHHLGTISIIKAWAEATRAHPTKNLAIVSHTGMLKWLDEYSRVEDLDMSRVHLISAVPGPRGHDSPTEQTADLQTYSGNREEVNGNSSLSNGDHASEGWVRKLGLELFNTVYVSHCNGAMAVSITFKSGFKISYSGDCLPSSNFAKIGVGSHVLIHEATLEDELREEAKSKKHSTPGGALVVAAEMKANVCLLTHFSQRYPKMPPLGGFAAPSNAITDGQELKEVLSDEHSGDEQEAGLTDVSTAAPMEVGDAEGDDPAVSHLIEASQRAEQAQPVKPPKTKIINESAVKRLVQDNNIKVLYAFDYMRFKLADVPRVEAAQPLLRQIYDLNLGQNVLSDWQKRVMPANMPQRG